MFWTKWDFIAAALFAVFAVAIRYFMPLIKKTLEEEDCDEKTTRYILLAYKGLFWLTALLSVGSLLLPLLEVVLGAFMEKVYHLWDKYGGLAIIIACAVAYFKFTKHGTQPAEPASELNDSDMAYAKEEADTLHDDLTNLVYNAALDIAEIVPIVRPRDASGIDTGKIRQVGLMAVHQYTLDVSADQPLNEAAMDAVRKELTRHMEQRSKRYGQLCPDDRPPVVYDVKNNGNFLLVEVVLYRKAYEDTLKNKFKARFDRQRNMGDTYDRDF